MQPSHNSISFCTAGGPQTALVTDGPIISLENGAFFAGCVGIGTNNPRAALEITGSLWVNGTDIYLNGRGGGFARENHYGRALVDMGTENGLVVNFANDFGRVFIDGEIWLNHQVYRPSDVRLKTNIRPLTNVLEKLNQMRGVLFEWNGGDKTLGRPAGTEDVGLIAQEVEAVFPELVGTCGEENYRSIDYGRLTAILVQAIKELNAKFETLQHAIENRDMLPRSA